MKFHHFFFGTLTAATLMLVVGVPKVTAQDMTAPQAATSAETPQPTKKTSLRDDLKTLEEKNQELENRVQALEANIQGKTTSPKNSSVTNPNPQDMVGPSGTSYEAVGTNGSGVHEEFLNFSDSSEYINSESRYLVFGNPKGNTVFRIGGYMFADFNYYFQPMSNYLLNDYVKQDPQYATIPLQKDYNGFVARKAHLAFGVRFNQTWGMDIGIESDKSTAVSLGFFHAYAYAKLAKWLVVTAGKFSNVLSLESLQPSADLPFLEASMITNLVPNKDLGIMVSGKVNHMVDYAVELANGVQDNESSAVSPQKAEQNGKAITARIFLTPFEDSGDDALEGLGLGIAGSIDNETQSHSISASDISPPQNVPWPNGLSTSLGGNEFAYDGGVAFADGPFYHWDPQFYWFAGPFGIQGEYVQSIQTVVAGSTEAPVQLTNTAWMAEGYFDLGGKPGFEGPQIDNPLDLSKDHWGDLEFVVRLHQTTADVKAFAVGFPYDPPGASLSTGAQMATAFGIGVNWWATNNFKLMLDFEKTEFSGGNAVDSVGNSTIPPEQVIFARAAVIM